MRKQLNDFKYFFPRIYKLILSMVIFVSLIGIMMMIPETHFTQAVGIAKLQSRVTALRHAVYWHSRVLLHPELKVEHSVLFGFLNAVDHQGNVSVIIPDGDSYVTREFKLADLQLTNHLATHALISLNRNESARFDIYDKSMMVVYLQGNPLNVELIERGLATPDPNPPSNIVDRVFAAHYWNIVNKK